MKYRVNRPISIGSQKYQVGEIVELGDIIDGLPGIETVDKVRRIEDDSPYSDEYVVAIQDIRVGPEKYIRGQIISLDNYTSKTLSRSLATARIMYVTEDIVMGVDGAKLRCEDQDCNAMFVSRSAKMRHKEMTGHKRKYKKGSRKTGDD